MDEETKAGIVRLLREMFAWGHEDFIPMMIDLMELHSRKNHDYAGGGDPLGNFRRVAQFFSMYPGLKPSDPAVVAMMYAMKQVDSYLWGKSTGIEKLVENIDERLKDDCVYFAIIRLLEREAKDKPGGTTG